MCAEELPEGATGKCPFCESDLPAAPAAAPEPSPKPPASLRPESPGPARPESKKRTPLVLVGVVSVVAAGVVAAVTLTGESWPAPIESFFASPFAKRLELECHKVEPGDPKSTGSIASCWIHDPSRKSPSGDPLSLGELSVEADVAGKYVTRFDLYTLNQRMDSGETRRIHAAFLKAALGSRLDSTVANGAAGAISKGLDLEDPRQVVSRKWAVTDHGVIQLEDYVGEMRITGPTNEPPGIQVIVSAGKAPVALDGSATKTLTHVSWHIDPRAAAQPTAPSPPVARQPDPPATPTATSPTPPAPESAPASQPTQCSAGDTAACEAQCNAGKAPACVMAASAFILGQGGASKDYKRAEPLLLRACTALKSHAACYQLAALYQDGGPGLTKDLDSALKFNKLACQLAKRMDCPQARLIEAQMQAKGTPDDAAPSPKPGSTPPATPPASVTLATLLDTNLPDAKLAVTAAKLVAQSESKRAVSSKLNTRGLRFYKSKLWFPAITAFETAHSIDPKFEFPVYNRACVAGLQKDASGAVVWLTKLKLLGTVKAKRMLLKAKKDSDFDRVRSSKVFKTFMTSMER
jgi:hypothetical protein